MSNGYVSWPVLALAAGIIVGIGLVTVLGVLLLEAQRRRDERATAFQNLLAEPISHELGLAGVSVLPTVRIPLLKGATRPAVIELSGRVPTREIRDRVLRLVEREARRLQYFRIEDRIRVERVSGDERRRSA